MPRTEPANRFEQDAVWGHVKDRPAIREKVRMFVHTIPEGVQTIVDVGCGDGAITNELARRWEVTGVDSSQTALDHVTAKSVMADATDLPFEDRSFDLVLSSQMLEHLDPSDYTAALSEILRVAREYVLISVPYREDLGLRLIRCPRCGWRGHVWGHRRTFTVDSLARGLNGFDVLDVRIFGDLQEPPWPRSFLWPIHNVFGGFYTSPGQNPLCGHCGNDDFSDVRGFPPYSDRVKAILKRLGRRPRLPFWLSVLAERSTTRT